MPQFQFLCALSKVWSPLKRVVATSILFVTLLLSASAVYAQFAYTNVNRAITITGYLVPNSEISIPRTFENQPVPGIGGVAFSGTGLFDVTITEIKKFTPADREETGAQAGAAPGAAGQCLKIV